MRHQGASHVRAWRVPSTRARHSMLFSVQVEMDLPSSSNQSQERASILAQTCTVPAHHRTLARIRARTLYSGAGRAVQGYVHGGQRDRVRADLRARSVGQVGPCALSVWFGCISRCMLHDTHTTHIGAHARTHARTHARHGTHARTLARLQVNTHHHSHKHTHACKLHCDAKALMVLIILVPVLIILVDY